MTSGQAEALMVCTAPGPRDLGVGNLYRDSPDAHERRELATHNLRRDAPWYSRLRTNLTRSSPTELTYFAGAVAFSSAGVAWAVTELAGCISR